MTDQLDPYLREHGYCFVCWAVSMGHLRRITEVRDGSDDPWRQLSSRLERWSPSEQVFPTSLALKSYLEDPEYKTMFEKYKNLFAENGGAMMKGVSVVEVEEKMEKRARLAIDMEVRISSTLFQ
jgi:hypothetical protein